MIQLINLIPKSQDMGSTDQSLTAEITTDGAPLFVCFVTFSFPYKKITVNYLEIYFYIVNASFHTIFFILLQEFSSR